MIDNNNELLREQLGKNGNTEVYTTGGTFSGKDFYCVYFPLESQVGAITVSDVTVGASDLIQTYPAGTTLFMNVTGLELTSGLAICYDEGPTT